MTKKETLVLLPGLLCDERLWQHQVAYFKQNYHIIIPDFSAHDTIENMVKSVIDQVKENQFYLAGLSMGGYVALEMLQLYPDRIKKLALLNTSARKDDVKMNRRRRALIAQVKGIGTFRGITNRLLKLLIDKTQLENEQLVELIKTMTQDIGKAIYLKHQHAILNRKSHLKILKDSHVSILCITGENDHIISMSETIEMADIIAQDKAIIIKNCGHLSALEQPEQINKYLEDFFRI